MSILSKCEKYSHLHNSFCIHYRKPTFLDLGCGNGFLTYILTQEGYHGFGIDQSKRKTWNLYDEKTILKG